MAELRIVPPPPLEEQRRSLRTALAVVVPGWRPLAADVLGDGDRIDWIGRDGDGRAVIALLADEGEDLALVARGIAQREWVTPRLRDWSQLAPEAGLRADAGVRLVLVARVFRSAALAAARVLPEGEVTCVCLRYVADGSGVVPLLERVGDPATAALDPRPAALAASFRGGLSDADLDLTPEERAEFDAPPPEHGRP